MSKFHIVSDLHLEKYHDRGLKVRNKILTQSVSDLANTLILAGDIGSLYPDWQASYEEHIKAFCEAYKNVVLVPGNHEFYGCYLDKGQRFLLDLKNRYPNFHPLVPGNSVASIDGKMIVGGTLWYQDLPSVRNQWFSFSDSYIRSNLSEILVEHINFTKTLDTHSIADIVVTHHAPSRRSIAPRFITSTINDYFTNDLDSIIMKYQPKLWVHGHMHDPLDYQIGSTRVFCNPHGYHYEDNNRMLLNRMLIEV